jgi:uncharacterized protein (TIGR03086 family)
MTTITSTWTVLDQAHAALRAAVSGAPADAWERPTPCSEWNLTQVLQHACGDQVAYAAFLTDHKGPAEDPFAPSGTLTGRPAELVEPALDASAQAFTTVGAEATDVLVPIPPGRLPAWLAAGACALDAAVHAWDLAVATGQPSPVNDALAGELLPVARELAEPLRGFAFADPVPGEGGGNLAVLLRYLGRDPEWTAP